MSETIRKKVMVDGKLYQIEVLRRTPQNPDAVAIVQPSHNALELTKASIDSIRRWTSVPYELWIVDNFSDSPVVDYLKNQLDVNLILNRTPIGGWTKRRLGPLSVPWPPTRNTWSRIYGGGAICNGVALELASRFVKTQRMFVMHNDVLVWKGWMEYLLSKMNDQVRGVAVSHDPSRTHAMHQSGFLFDFTLFSSLNMTFLPNLPDYDPGDMVTVRLHEAGFETFICKNTRNHPESVGRVKESSLRAMYCDRVFDDSGDVIYLHLGRGTPKVNGTYQQEGRTTSQQWLKFAAEQVLAEPARPVAVAN